MLRTMTLLAVIIGVFPSKGFGATTSMRVLYPSFAGTWAVAWVAKEAGYFASEGLDVELIRVGGSTRMVGAMLGGSAPIIQAGASAAISSDGSARDQATLGFEGEEGGHHHFRFHIRPGRADRIEAFRVGAQQRCSDSYFRRAT